MKTRNRFFAHRNADIVDEVSVYEKLNVLKTFLAKGNFSKTPKSKENRQIQCKSSGLLPGLGITNNHNQNGKKPLDMTLQRFPSGHI